MSKRTNDDRKRTEDPASVFKIPKKEMMVTRGRTIKMRRQLRIKDSAPNKECAIQKSSSPKSPTKVKSPSSKGKIAEKSKLQCKIILKPPQKLLKIKPGIKNKRKSACPQKRQDVTPVKQTNIKAAEKTAKENNSFPQVKEKANKKGTGLPHVKENADKEEMGFSGFQQESSKESGTKRSLKQRCMEDERIKECSLAEVIHLREFSEELTDDDLLEIVQCPSPVWWEESLCDRHKQAPFVLPPSQLEKEKTPERIPTIKLQPVNVAQIQDSTNMKEYLSKRTVLEKVLTGLKDKAKNTGRNSLIQQHKKSAQPSDSSIIEKSNISSNSDSIDTKYQKSSLGSSVCTDDNKSVILPIKNDSIDAKNTNESSEQSVECSDNERTKKSSMQKECIEKPKDIVTLEPNTKNPLPKLERIGGPKSLLISNQTSNVFEKVLNPTSEINELLIKKMHAHLPKIKGVTANCMKFIKIIPQGPQAQGKKVYSGNDSAELIPNKVKEVNLFDVIDLSDEPEKESAGPSEVITIHSPVKENDPKKSTQENASEFDTVEVIEEDVLKDLENLKIPISTLTQECIIIDEDEGNTQNEKTVPFLDQREPSGAPFLSKKLEEPVFKQNTTRDTVMQNQFGKDCDNDSECELSVNVDKGKRVKRKHDNDSDISKQPKRNCSENMHKPANTENTYVAPPTLDKSDSTEPSHLQQISGNIHPFNEAEICEGLLLNEFEKPTNQVKAALDKNEQTNSKFTAPSNEQDKTLDQKTADTSKYTETDIENSHNTEASMRSKSVKSKIKQVYQELISRRHSRKSTSSISSEQSTTELAIEEKSSIDLLTTGKNYSFLKAERELTYTSKMNTENQSTRSEFSPNLNQDDFKNNNLNEPGVQAEKILQQEKQEVVIILNNRDETEGNCDNGTATVHFENDNGPIMYEVVTSDIEILESLNDTEITFESCEPLSDVLTPDKVKSEIFSELDGELNNVTYYELESDDEPEYENINRIPMTKEMIDNIIGIQDTKAVTSGPEALEQIVLHGVNPIAASKKNIVIAKKENVKYCFKCSSIYDTEECCYCQKQKNQPLAVNDKYSCDLCTYTTKKRFLFKKHASMHTNEGYCCDSCKSMFKSKACLRIHILRLCRMLVKKKDNIKIDSPIEVQSNGLDSKKLQKQILDETSGYIVILTES